MSEMKRKADLPLCLYCGSTKASVRTIRLAIAYVHALQAADRAG